MMTNIARRFAVVATLVAAGTAVALGGCSNTAANLLTTGSIAGKKPEGPKPESPVDRMLQVAALSARAQKCGYAFNPTELRANFLAAETAGGLGIEQAASLGNQYDFTYRTIASRLAPKNDYCDSSRLTLIKADLNRYLTGDYRTRVAKRAIQKGLFENDDAPTTRTEINPEFGRLPGAQPTHEVKVE